MSKTKFIKNVKGIKGFENVLDSALEELALEAVDKVVSITPRDLKRPPKDSKARVTWSLKRSIGYEKVWKWKYKVGSKMGATNTASGEETNTYWMHLEFWTKFMRPRSFLRKWIFDNIKPLQNFLIKLLKTKLK